MKISLCLLVWNEVQGCKIDVPELPRNCFDEIYAIDGGSTDGTIEYLSSQGIAVYKQPKKGLNAAYIHAVEKSTCDAVVVFFPKGTISPQSLTSFRRLFEAGNQLVLASRNIKGAHNEEDDKFLKPRKWCVTAMASFVALLWRREGHFIRDVLHGYKGFTVAAFQEMAPQGEGLSIDLELAVRSYRLRLKRVEFPVVEIPRPFGETYFKIFPTGIKLLKFLWLEVKRSF